MTLEQEENDFAFTDPKQGEDCKALKRAKIITREDSVNHTYETTCRN